MIVLKFGGSSVGKPERIKSIGDILTKRILENREELAVICSAFGGITDLLIKMAHKASRGKESYHEELEEFINVHNASIKDLQIENEKTKTYFEDIFTTLTNLLKGIFLVREASPRTMDYVLSFGERSSNFIIAEYLQTRGISANYLDAREIIKTNRTFGKAVVNFDITYPKIRDYITSHKGYRISKWRLI